mmetsp:Transcript_2873/g.6693  ORF Transcript_2873/g.6693 Transcript_2873/m.6693 type:complete len:781 (+) Transcript_2873:155-2497(+)
MLHRRQRRHSEDEVAMTSRQNSLRNILNSSSNSNNNAGSAMTLSRETKSLRRDTTEAFRTLTGPDQIFSRLKASKRSSLRSPLSPSASNSATENFESIESGAMNSANAANLTKSRPSDIQSQLSSYVNAGKQQSMVMNGSHDSGSAYENSNADVSRNSSTSHAKLKKRFHLTKGFKKNIMRQRPHVNEEAASGTTSPVHMNQLASRSVPEDESREGSPRGLQPPGVASVGSREYKTGFGAKDSASSMGESNGGSLGAASKRKKPSNMQRLRDKMMARGKQRGVLGANALRRHSRLSSLTKHGHEEDDDEEEDDDHHDDDDSDEVTQIGASEEELDDDEDTGDAQENHSDIETYGRACQGSPGNRTAFSNGSATIGFNTNKTTNNSRFARQDPTTSTSDKYCTEDESSEYSKNMLGSDLDALGQVSSQSNGRQANSNLPPVMRSPNTAKSPSPDGAARRSRRSSMGPIQGGIPLDSLPNMPATAGDPRLEDDIASDDGMSSSTRGGVFRDQLDEHSPGRLDEPRSFASGSSHSSRAQMRHELADMLEKWNIPREQWRLPTADISPGSVDEFGGDSDAVADPRRNEYRIRKLQEENERYKSLIAKRKVELDRVHSSTKTKVNELKDMIRNLERKLAFYDANVNEKHAQINEHFTRFKSEMTNDIREKVRKQLESREEDYYNLIERVQRSMTIISDHNSEGNGIIHAVMHRSIALVISGAGTIAHIISMLVGMLLAPFLYVLSFFKRTENVSLHRQRPGMRSRTSSQSSGFSRASRISSRGLS